MIYTERPADFAETLPQVVACYLQHDGRFLLLQRQPHKPFGGTWGLPAGKVDKGESPENSIVREVFEETGVRIEQDVLTHLQPLWVRHAKYDFEYHSFALPLTDRPDIMLSINEHQAYAWVTSVEASALELIHDLEECNRLLL